MTAALARPTILLLHGWTMRGAIFDDQVRRLGDRFRVLAPDMPGHGAAAHLPPTLKAGADLVARCIEGLDSPPVVVGWSMGAAIAWSYVMAHGAGALGGLVTIDMSPRIVNGSGWTHGLKNQTEADVRRSTERFAADWGRATHAIAATMFARPEGTPGMGRAAAQAMIASHDPHIMRAIWAELVAMDLRAAIPEVTVPYLAAYGAQSRVYPASAAAWIAAAAPEVRIHAFAQSGHSPHLEEPDAFAEVIGAFADKVTSGR